MKKGQVILDPMCGSGMVLGQASRKGVSSIGYDLDPLARLISRTGATRVVEKNVREDFSSFIETCSRDIEKEAVPYLPWIDDDEETLSFIRFWFGKRQENVMRIVSKHLILNPISTNKKNVDLLKVAISRLIITKEPKISLARDTAHSRPHRTITSNDFDILRELPSSLEHVLKALQTSQIIANAKTYQGDARNMARLGSETIDAIITSPPYLNAIDYMRGHRLSLVWFGYSIKKLREIRSKTIGTERSAKGDANTTFIALAQKLGLNELENKHYRMLSRYFSDLSQQTNETTRVLKPGGTAMYVIGNSVLKGVHIQNSELLKTAAAESGLRLVSEAKREIPNNRRYLPINVNSSNSLAGRMRIEHILEFINR